MRDIEFHLSNLTISWNPLFSQNLTNVEPNIVYCVEVYNITCGERELLISDCDVTETSYTSDVIAPDGMIRQVRKFMMFGALLVQIYFCSCSYNRTVM